MDFQTACKLTNDEAREYFEKLRWGDKPKCAHCESENVVKLNGKATRKGVYKCRVCVRQFTVTVNSIFTGSHIELRHWVMAFCLICSSKKSMSALQVQRMLGLGSYKTAWHLCHRIRCAMAQEPLKGLLDGIVESDETWVGGHFKCGTQGPQLANKVAVHALIERGGKMRARVIKRVTVKNLRKNLDELVSEKATLHTDGLQAYKGPGKRFVAHESVDHTKYEYSRGNVHVNTCESFFALLKRQVHGTHHSVAKHHLQRYVNERVFGWNTKDMTDAERTETAIRQAPGARLMYKAKSA